MDTTFDALAQRGFPAANREADRVGQLLSRAFVDLAESRTECDSGDVGLLACLVGHSIELIGATAGGVLLGDLGAELTAVAASGGAAEHLGVLQCQVREGPGLDCHAAGAPVGVTDLAAALDRWPALAASAARHGVPVSDFAQVQAVPLRRGGQVIGALCLYGTRPSAADLALCQALADAATITLLDQRATARVRALTAQLQHALDTRVIIEQAKGIVAQDHGLNMDEAFDRLRRHARDHNTRLLEVARSIVCRELDPAQLGNPLPRTRRSTGRRSRW